MRISFSRTRRIIDRNILGGRSPAADTWRRAQCSRTGPFSFLSHRLIRIAALLLCVAAGAEAQSRREVSGIDFDGAVSFSEKQLRDVIRSQETPWVVWQWLYTISENFGSPPAYADPLTIDGDAESLRRFYENQGFFRATVRPEVIPDNDAAVIRFTISEGVRAVVDSVTLRGIDGLPQPVREELLQEPLITAGDPFVYPLVEDEFRRLLAVMTNNGFVNVKVPRKEAIGHDNASSFWVLFEFDPGLQHKFGDVTILHDTTSAERIEDGVILRHLDFGPGDTYSEIRKQESERQLNRLGVFDATRVEIAGQVSLDSLVSVPMEVTVRTRAFQELRPEIGFNDEDNQFNALVGLGYNHRNFFGGARNFNTSFRYSLRSIANARFDRLFSGEGLRDSTLVSKAEFSVQLTQPYFFSNKISLTSSISAILDKRKTVYIPILRGKVGTVAQTAMYTRFLADWNLEWIDPKSVTTSQDTVLGDLYEKQFNSILTLTLRSDHRNDLFNPSGGYIHTIVVEEAGLMPKLYSAAGGKPLPYSQYYKLILLGQWYWPGSSTGRVVFAAKSQFGFAQRFGESPNDVPITRKFYSGGSGSVRGWKARELGVVDRPEYGGNAVLEMSAETRFRPFESTEDVLFLDPSKIAFTLFADAGNIWQEVGKMRPDQLAAAAGIGFRYNTVAGPIRIDFGLKVYDPLAAEDRRWISSKKFFSETLAGGVIHLGIGHAF